MWRVIDRSQSKKVMAFRQSYQAAVELAETLEVRLNAITDYLIERRRAA